MKIKIIKETNLNYIKKNYKYNYKIKIIIFIFNMSNFRNMNDFMKNNVF
jgi:hypothetical protein